MRLYVYIWYLYRHFLLSCRVSAVRLAIILMGVQIQGYVFVAFTLQFLYFFFVLIFVIWLICVSLCLSLGLFFVGFFVLPQLKWLFRFPFYRSFNYYLWIFFWPFFCYPFSLLLLNPYYVKLVCVMLSQRSLRPFSVLFILFSLFFFLWQWFTLLCVPPHSFFCLLSKRYTHPYVHWSTIDNSQDTVST